MTSIYMSKWVDIVSDFFFGGASLLIFAKICFRESGINILLSRKGGKKL